MVKVKRLETFDGITIKVVLKSKRFTVFIMIEEGCYLWHERKTENCAIKFITPYSKRIAGKAIKLKVTNQSYNTSKLCAPFRKNFDLPNGGTCLLYLSPIFFLPEDLAEKCRKDMENATPSKKSPQLLFAPITKVHRKETRKPINRYHPYT